MAQQKISGAQAPNLNPKTLFVSFVFVEKQPGIADFLALLLLTSSCVKEAGRN